MAYTVEKNVPLPETRGRWRVYPFNEMEVGDSFAVSLADQDKVKAAASYFGSRNGLKFSLRKYDDAYRCWRVA